MVAAIKQTVTVQADGSIEIRSPQLRPGSRAEVIVLIDSATSNAHPEISNGDADQAWSHFRALGQRLASTSVAGAPSLTDAVSQSRR